MSAPDSRWREEVTASAGNASVPVFFPRRVNNVTVKAIPGGGGSAVVSFTLDDPSDVRSNPDAANWDPWEASDVTVPTTLALVGPVTALRIEATGADAVLQVVGAFDF